jgi:formate dehydrogenase major subunit
MDSECVSCGACVQHCPTEALIEKSLIEHGAPDRSVTTTCAYCGVGCSFHAELKGDRVLRMVPDKAGKANEGHACVKGRFAFGYATHQDRITQPLIRESIDQPWREVGWDEAFAFTAARLRDIQQRHGRDSIGGITSSRCTNEETYLVQKMVRALRQQQRRYLRASLPFADRLWPEDHAGESAGTQASTRWRMLTSSWQMGASQRRASGVRLPAETLTARGARLIVVDPRRIDLVTAPASKTDHHLPCGRSNVRFHQRDDPRVVTEGPGDRLSSRPAASGNHQKWREFITGEQNFRS